MYACMYGFDVLVHKIIVEKEPAFVDIFVAMFVFFQ
jgi:hypothetical protein